MPIEKICEYCSKPFSIRPSHSAQKFCNAICKSGYETEHGRPAARLPMVNFNCRECGTPYSYKPAQVAFYEKKFGHPPQYCSIACSAIGRRKDTMERRRFTCLQCGKEQSRRRKPSGRVYEQQKFCDRACKAAYQEAQALDRYNKGIVRRHEKRHGYLWVSIPALANGGKKGAIMEHRHVMQKHIGRKLYPEETVHHRDGDRQNNAIENLELFSSRHGPGQRVIDKVRFAIDVLRLYPEFARSEGVELRAVEHTVTDPEPLTEPN